MAYHILIASSEETVFEAFLGSAMTLGLYWEAVARSLSLPIISTMVQAADSEKGLTLDGESVQAFDRELEALESFWRSNEGVYRGLEVPENFFENMAEIRRGVRLAIESRLQVDIY